MATTTPMQLLPVPSESDTPDVPRDVSALAVAVEKRLFGVYNSVADRDAKITSPTEGQVAYLKDVDKVYLYITSWTQLWPVTGLPVISSGTAAPDNANGANGDVYLQV